MKIQRKIFISTLDIIVQLSTLLDEIVEEETKEEHRVTAEVSKVETKDPVYPIEESCLSVYDIESIQNRNHPSPKIILVANIKCLGGSQVKIQRKIFISTLVSFP